MFQEKRGYYLVLENDGSENDPDFEKNEFGYVYRILIEITPMNWKHGSAIQIRVIKLIENKNHEHLAYGYFDRWFYDKEFELPYRTLMSALIKGEISGATATSAVYDIFLATLKIQNFVAKFMPNYWAKWVKLMQAENDYPKPSDNPGDWGSPALIRPFAEIVPSR
ncbi:MAG: hypothetical protein AAB575_04040 [Patescibacteria group bacterium]|mgnify:FL=1